MIMQGDAMEAEIGKRHRAGKIVIMAVLLSGASFLTYYCHVVLKTGAVFTHLFYIPIVLAALWWQKRGMVVAIFLSGLLIASHLFLRLETETANDFLRAPLLLLISGVVALLSEGIQKREARIRESEERFRTLVGSSLTGFSIIQDGRVVYQNPEQERLLGALPRLPQFTDLRSVHPDDLEKVRDFSRRISAKDFETLDADFRFYTRDPGSDSLNMKWVTFRAIQIDYQGKEATLVNAMDITKSKEMEHLLRIQDKMISLGRVATGIAHEIRNPLSGINVYLNTLHNIYDKGESLEKVKRIIDQIQSASGKIESVIKRVMDFSKPTKPQFVRLDINSTIEEVLKLSSITIRKSGISIRKNLAPELPRCYADAHLMEVVLVNLISNAAEAMKQVPGEKMLEISASAGEDSLFITIADSGPGIPPNLRTQIFDPFYTTKGGGTGIGLSICSRIITDHGGSLQVSESTLGGAAFTIELPVKQE